MAEEKPDWTARLKESGRIATLVIAAPALWFRVVYFLFAYLVIVLGLYLLLSILPYAHFLKI